jgi:hypothetical protein
MPGTGRPLRASARLSRRQLVLPLLLYGAVPWLGYHLLTARHVPTLTALCLLAVVPALGIVIEWARTRSVNVIGGLSLATILLGVAGALVTGDPRVILAHGSLLSGALGLACLVSVTGIGGLRPLPLLLLREPGTGDREQRLRSPGFQRLVRRLTLLWGVALVGEALLRVLIAFQLPASAVLAISPLLLPVVVVLMAGLSVGLIHRSHHARGLAGPDTRHDREIH